MINWCSFRQNSNYYNMGITMYGIKKNNNNNMNDYLLLLFYYHCYYEQKMKKQNKTKPILLYLL